MLSPSGAVAPWPESNAAKRNVARTLHLDVRKGALATTMMQFLNPALDGLERNL